MTDPDLTKSDHEKTSTSSPLSAIFTQANLTTGLAVFATLLAVAPYALPQLQSFQVQRGLMAHPVMLESAIAKLRADKKAAAAKQATEAVKSHQDSLFADPTDPVLGNPKAQVRVVEFLDYNCGYCRAASPEVKAFLAANPDVAIVVKELPIINASSRPLASYALAASLAGHYEEVHYAFMDSHVKTEQDVFDILTRLRLDPNALKAVAASKDVQEHIDRVTQLSSDLGIDGTPAFVVNGNLINGADLNGLKVAVAAARASKKS